MEPAAGLRRCGGCGRRCRAALRWHRGPEAEAEAGAAGLGGAVPQATMGKEEEVARIARRLDKMVSKKSAVRGAAPGTPQPPSPTPLLHVGARVWAPRVAAPLGRPPGSPINPWRGKRRPPHTHGGALEQPAPHPTCLACRSLDEDDQGDTLTPSVPRMQPLSPPPWAAPCQGGGSPGGGAMEVTPECSDSA